MYRRNRRQRVHQYTYDPRMYPKLCPVRMPEKHIDWEQILSVSNLEKPVESTTALFNNKKSMKVEGIIHLLETRIENYKCEDDMRYGICRMNEWDRGYYKGNSYIYGWEWDKMYDFTEELEGDVDDELD